MTDLNELMRQAQKMQDQFKQAQEGLSNLVVEGQSGAGLVVIKLNGRMTWSLSVLMTQL